MKKLFPYIIGFILILVIGILIIGKRKNASKRFIEDITLRQKDKIPYGTSIARSLLPSLFPNSLIYEDMSEPGSWDSLIYSSYNQAVVIMTRDLEADEEEMKRLIWFAQQGNYIFIIAHDLSEEASKAFGVSVNNYIMDEYLNMNRDSLAIRLEKPVFDPAPLYVYPGKKYQSTFVGLDSGHIRVLGRDKDQAPNFIELKTGNGRIFVHMAPLAFSNYFILHKNNIEYFQKALSVIPSSVKKITWNEYYMAKPSKPDDNSSEPDMFRVFMNYDEFKWGLLTGLFMLFLYVVLGSRRKQRKIAPYSKPRNASLDFVTTIGRLYHDRRDHTNLAKKMSQYFLDTVRADYKLNTSVLDDSFVNLLHHKSGYDEEELKQIVSYINYLEADPQIPENDLYRFHKQLEVFYQNT